VIAMLTVDYGVSIGTNGAGVSPSYSVFAALNGFTASNPTYSDSNGNGQGHTRQVVTNHFSDGTARQVSGVLGLSANGYQCSVTPSATARVFIYSTDPQCTITSCSGIGALPPLASLSAAAGAGGLQLAWPNDQVGWQLQVQTNSLAVGVSTNWVTIPGTASTNSFSVPIERSNPAVFYRLIYQ
jgi:hypothetical protein